MRHDLTKFFLLPLIGIVGALIFFEIFLSVFTPQEHAYLEEYKNGYTFNRPNYHYKYSFNPDFRLHESWTKKKTLFQSFQVPVETNDWGQRDEITPPLEKKENRLRILSLGDSFSFGWPMPFEKSYLKKLREKIPSAEWINCAAMGAGAQQMLLVFKNECTRFQPNIVLIQIKMHARPSFPDTIAMDREGPHLRLIQLAFQTLGEKTFDYVQWDKDGMPFFPPESLEALQKDFISGTTPKLPFYHSLNVARFFEHFFLWRGALTSEKVLVWHERLVARIPPSLFHSATEKAVLEIRNLAAKTGAKVLVVLIPGAYYFRDALAPRPDWDKLLADLKDQKVPLLDLRTPIGEALNGQPVEQFYFANDSHPNEMGYDFMTSAISAGLRKEFHELE